MKDHNTIENILERIKVADKESPISVFKNHKGLFAVHGRTVQTSYWINKGMPEHIGTFDSTYNPDTVTRILRDNQRVLQCTP